MSCKPLILGIETSTSCGGVALADTHGVLLDHHWECLPAGTPRRVLPAIVAALGRVGGTKSDLAAIAVSTGPGSFTGVRTGLGIAKTLANGLEIPLYLFSTLSAAARRGGITREPVCVILDARRSEIYSGIYRFESLEGAATVLRESKVEACATLLDSIELQAAHWGAVWFTGDGASACRSEIESRLGGRAHWVPEPLNRPGADILAVEGARALAAGRRGDNPMEAVPEYLRASDAERNLARRTP